VEAITAALQDRTPALVLLFVSPSFDLAAVASAAESSVPRDAPVIGCTTSGEIADGAAGSGRIAAVALGGPGFAVQVSAGALAEGGREAGRAAARALAGLDRPYRVLLLLHDGLAGERSQVVRGAYSVAGSTVPLVGGCAGDELAMVATHQLLDGRVLTGSVIGAAIGSDAPIGVGVGHGWTRIGEPMVVTHSDGHRIFTLDDEPALDHYLRRVGAGPEVLADDELWRHTTLRRPLGLSRPGGEEIRAVLGTDHGDRSLSCSDVPQGTVIWAMAGDPDSVNKGTRAACDEALAGLHGAPALGVIAFDCAARRAILGESGLVGEVAVMHERLGEVPVGGFYTYGEIARTRGARGVHNATLVLLALA